jgi:uncharacterized RDD family membrane protein YckC
MALPVLGGAIAPPAVPNYQIAGLDRRFGAFLLDGLVIWIASAVIAAIVDPAGLVTTTTTATTSTTTVMVSNTGWSGVIVAAVTAAYAIPTWIWWGATPGQKALGLRVFRMAGPQPLAIVSGAIRWAALYGSSLLGALAVGDASIGGALGLMQVGWVLALLFSTIQDPRKRGWHDRLAGSLVVRH